jgi:BCD family chlorophyll transporter-like MFS transporter
MQQASPRIQTAGLSWVSIVRLGLVQMALGSVVVLTNSTINRVMVVELALPAALPGLLVALHFAVQLLRPRWGYGSDQGGRCTPWIIAGMAILCLGGFLAAAATAWMATSTAAGLALATFAFLLIGIGVGASGTNLLVLLAKRVAPERRAAAATIVWIMMIVGFIITTALAGKNLDPFSLSRLVAVAGTVSLVAFLVAVAGVWGIERNSQPVTAPGHETAKNVPFFAALKQVWSEPDARQFTIFVFVSMLAYSMQDLILEPYAGEIFRYTPGASTRLSSVQHGGVLVGMLIVAIGGSLLPAAWRVPLKSWIMLGCLASAGALAAIALSGQMPLPVSFRTLVFMLGLANGVFAIAAIGSMMMLASEGRGAREGVRMGLWGAAQAIAFGAGGLVGAVCVDFFRRLVSLPADAYAIVFILEAGLFVAAAALALRIGGRTRFTAADTGARVHDVGANLMPLGPAER